MIKLFTILFFFIVVIPYSAHSQQEDANLLAEKYLVVTKEKEKKEKLMNLMQVQMTQQVTAEAEARKMKGNKLEFLKIYTDKMMGIIVEELSWEKNKGHHISVIQTIYTNDELRALIQFFESDLGKLYIEKQQISLQMLAEISKKSIENMMRRLRELEIEISKEFKKP